MYDALATLENYTVCEASERLVFYWQHCTGKYMIGNFCPMVEAEPVGTPILWECPGTCPSRSLQVYVPVPLPGAQPLHLPDSIPVADYSPASDVSHEGPLQALKLLDVSSIASHVIAHSHTLWHSKT